MLKLFDFKCQDCGQEYERLVDDKKPLETICPACNSLNTQRGYTKSSFKVHGAGAYNTKMVV